MIRFLSLRMVMTITLALSAQTLHAESQKTETFTATVVRPLATPDVLVLKTGSGEEMTVRLFGLAAPLAEQPYAAQMTDYLLKNLEGLTFTVEVLTTDNSDLPVAWLRPSEGVSLNESLVAQGLAWWDEVNAPDATPLKNLAADALIAGKGLWQDSTPLAPWDFRTSHQLEDVTYEVEPAPVLEVETLPPPSDTPTLAAKGTMTETPPSVELPALPQDYMGLMATHQPHIQRDEQGNSLGVTASNIAAIPGASQLGFQNGDIVRSVNGIALTSEAQVLGLVSQLQGAKELKLQVIRGGKPVTITIPL